jgi:hypothetical protein
MIRSEAPSPFCPSPTQGRGKWERWKDFSCVGARNDVREVFSGTKVGTRYPIPLRRVKVWEREMEEKESTEQEEEKSRILRRIEK